MLTSSQLPVTLKQFIAMPRETEWLEFKYDFQNQEKIRWKLKIKATQWLQES